VDHDPHRREVFRYLFRLSPSIFFEMVKWRLHLKVRIISSQTILAPVLCLAPVEGARSHVPGRFLEIRSVGALSGQSLSIYSCYYW
jgi:hypothetical protein